jgi:hypothetical protein
LTILLGCGPKNLSGPSVQEPSFAEQVALVEIGQNNAIYVSLAPLTDADLAKLQGASGLLALHVENSSSHITADGLRHLTGLKSLNHLWLRCTGIDDAALAEIAQIKSLEILNLPQADLTDDGLPVLKELPKLVQLRFGSPRVTDAGMKTLTELPALTRLHLIEVPITDAGLAELAKIERLESLYVDGGSISDAAWDELFQRRPKLHVHVNQQHHDRDPHKHDH